MEMVEKTELIRRLSFYALSKIHQDRYRSFLKIFLLLSWDINLNPGSGHGFVIDIGYMYFHFLIVIFLKTVLTII